MYMYMYIKRIPWLGLTECSVCLCFMITLCVGKQCTCTCSSKTGPHQYIHVHCCDSFTCNNTVHVVYACVRMYIHLCTCIIIKINGFPWSKYCEVIWILSPNTWGILPTQQQNPSILPHTEMAHLHVHVRTCAYVRVMCLCTCVCIGTVSIHFHLCTLTE